MPSSIEQLIKNAFNNVIFMIPEIRIFSPYLGFNEYFKMKIHC